MTEEEEEDLDIDSWIKGRYINRRIPICCVATHIPISLQTHFLKSDRLKMDLGPGPKTQKSTKLITPLIGLVLVSFSVSRG